MKFTTINRVSGFSKTVQFERWMAIAVLIVGMIATIVATQSTHQYAEAHAANEYALVCNEIAIKVSTRLHAHALLLRSGSAFFTLKDTVTRNEWKEYYEHLKLEKNLPGILGFGFSMIIPVDQLEQHIQNIRKEGFAEYTVYPAGQRDVYTSIIYLEPFSGRNLRAFGYDMFSEPTRRKAMEISRDNDVAMLSGKVALKQETKEDIQSGTLMYVPFYKYGMAVNTVEQRRQAIRGWIYSPYRMNDLMQGILGHWDLPEENRIHLQVYDDTISEVSLLFDSQQKDTLARNDSPARNLSLPVEFNGKKWLLCFSQSSDQQYYFHGKVLVVFISGIIISFLLFTLSSLLFKIVYRSKQIKEQNDELQKLNAQKDKFFSIIAHDLKSPFNAIVGFSEILVEDVNMKNYSAVEKHADIIKKSSEKAMGLLSNLMEWSRSQTGRINFNPAHIDISNPINEVASIFDTIARQKSITIKTEFNPGTQVFADMDMLNTILRNLVSNAIKFTRPGGEIIISTERNQNEIKVAISDNGVGIKKQNIGKLFRIDENYSTPGTEKEGGTGLGLILCKEFVEKHGGKIWVESIFGEGSTFYFTIPF